MGTGNSYSWSDKIGWMGEGSLGRHCSNLYIVPAKAELSMNMGSAMTNIPEAFPEGCKFSKMMAKSEFSTYDGS